MVTGHKHSCTRVALFDRRKEPSQLLISLANLLLVQVEGPTIAARAAGTAQIWKVGAKEVRPQEKPLASHPSLSGSKWQRRQLQRLQYRPRLIVGVLVIDEARRHAMPRGQVVDEPCRQ
jgi:hypothetical protein